MSDDILDTQVGSEQGGNVYNDNQVNGLLRNKLARQEEKLRREFSDELDRVRSATPQFDRNALLQEARESAKAELQSEMHRLSKEQDEARFNMQFAKDKGQYDSHTKGITLPDDEDECGLFKPQGEKKYLALQIAAGNLNLEDTPEILKELARNPHKLVAAQQAAYNGDFDAVKAMFKTISKSIKNNKDALDSRKNATQPLSHLKPSSGGSSTRTPSLDDYRNDRSLYF